MPPPHRAEALSDDARLTSDDVCLSRTSGLSREHRGLGRIKIGTEVAHVTLNSDTTFKVKRSKVNLQGAERILWRPRAQLVITAEEDLVPVGHRSLESKRSYKIRRVTPSMETINN